MPALPFVNGLLGWNGKNPNMADSDSDTSCAIGAALLQILGISNHVAHVGQTAGRQLEVEVRNYLTSALPASWNGQAVTVSRRTVISDFEQYKHLDLLKKLIDGDTTRTLRAAIGSDYLIKPDVTVGLARSAGEAFLHAAVPCKWTLRSDRAQNVRHEAVILIRHRRGRLPHITPVTAEPLPSRIASLARGTAEVDAVYHVALDELFVACQRAGTNQQIATLEELIAHRRLRDLAELAPILATT